MNREFIKSELYCACLHVDSTSNASCFEIPYLGTARHGSARGSTQVGSTLEWASCMHVDDHIGSINLLLCKPATKNRL